MTATGWKRSFGFTHPGACFRHAQDPLCDAESLTSQGRAVALIARCSPYNRVPLYSTSRVS